MQSDNEIWSVNKENMRNIFLEKSYTKCGTEIIPRPFLKNQNEDISGSIVQSFLKFVFIVCQVDAVKIHWS